MIAAVKQKPIRADRETYVDSFGVERYRVNAAVLLIFQSCNRPMQALDLLHRAGVLSCDELRELCQLIGYPVELVRQLFDDVAAAVHP